MSFFEVLKKTDPDLSKFCRGTYIFQKILTPRGGGEDGWGKKWKGKKIGDKKGKKGKGEEKRGKNGKKGKGEEKKRKKERVRVREKNGVVQGWGKYKGKKNKREREEKRREIKDSRARGENGVKGGTEAITCSNT